MPARKARRYGIASPSMRRGSRDLQPERDVLQSHLVSHALLIGGLQQTGAERAMNFDGATDDAMRQRIVVFQIAQSSSPCSLCLSVLSRNKNIGKHPYNQTP